MSFQRDFNQDYSKLISESIHCINTEHNYIKAYNKAIQANLVAEMYLEDIEKTIESTLIVGLAYLNVDQLMGHNILQNLFINNYDLLKLNDNLFLRVRTALARAKRIIGEYDAAIQIFKEILNYVEKRLEVKKDGVLIAYQAGIATCLYEITICLLLKYKEENNRTYLLQLEKVLEDKNPQEKLDLLENIIKNDANYFETNPRDTLKDVEKYALKTIEYTSKFELKELGMIATLNMGCLLIEQGEYAKSLEKFEEIIEEPYIQEHLLGNVLNEVALIKLKNKNFEDAKIDLDRAWKWLSVKKDIKELCRNCYIHALYYIKMGNLDMAYASADYGNKQNNDMSCLELLYIISLYKSLDAKRKGNETEYIFHQYQIQKYTNNIKRRG